MADPKRTPARELILAAIESSKVADRLMRAALERSFQPNLITGVDRKLLDARTRQIRASASPHQVTYKALRYIAMHRLGMTRSISFSAKILESAESRFVAEGNGKWVLRPSWKLDIKNRAYNFVDAIGARRPASNKEHYSFDEVPKTTPGVIKATQSTGSRGVYLMYSDEFIVHAVDGRKFGTMAEVESDAQRLMNHASRPVRDKWMWEELILEDAANRTPARDLKFYAFYGEILLVRESKTVDGKLKVAYWNQKGEQTEMGHPQNYDFDRVGFSLEEAHQVSEISSQIPHPFVRIDMLKGENELVLGEFTPHPGNFDEFTPEWDRILGEAWVRADSRLKRDLLEGKSFAPFLEATGLLNS